jgi:type II secretory pathway component PulK
VCGARPDTANRGFALVLVIIVVLLASFLASQLIMQVRTELTVSHNIKARVSGHFLAEAGLSLGLFRLLDRSLDVPPIGAEVDWEDFFEGYEYQVFLPKGKVCYYVASEGGKIDLNKSPPALLELFLRYQLGEDKDEEVATVIDSLQDWRDNDDLYREHGAESEFYGALDDPYIARNGKIEDPADFFLIKGTRPMIGKFYAQEIFTVHSTDGKINFNSLTPAMLDFLTGGDKEKAVAYHDAKVELKGRLSAAIASEILGDRYEKFQAYLTYATANNPYYFVVGTGYAGVEQGADQQGRVEGETKAPKNPGTIDSMIIKKEGGGFTCLAWQERFT